MWLTKSKIYINFSLNKFANQIISARLFVAKNMSTNCDSGNETIKSIFLNSLNFVSPKSLIKNVIKRDKNILCVNDVKYELNKNMCIVGFGKAVLSMASEVVCLTEDHLQRGILSIPLGASKEISTSDLAKLAEHNLTIYEGAENNLPDERAMETAIKIQELVKTLNETHILLVLISGGGSALLPLPVPPITLQEKTSVIRSLASSGADIMELNTVRKRISVVKGGGLARLAAPAQIVSLILSDVIGDPIDFIASGPTVENTDSQQAALQIIQKYNLLEKIPLNVRRVLETNISNENKFMDNNKVQNVIIGNNKMAIEAAADKARDLNYFPIILSDSIQGNVIDVCTFYDTLIKLFLDCMSRKISPETMVSVIQTESSSVYDSFCLNEDKLREFLDEGQRHKGVCFIAGGEPTVIVRGSGKGGRNQELALRMSLKLHDLKGNFDENTIIYFLSAGTDGIDGPTNAAGAVVSQDLITEALELGINAENYIQSNDSFNFYKEIQNGKNLILTGHTGTNVMDVHIILIENKIQ